MHYGFRIRNLVLAVLGVIFLMLMVDCIEPDSPVINKNQPTQTVAPTSPPVQSDIRYESCEDAPGVIFRGEPGYRPQLDRDKDGKACE